jgi:hypothetical protein
MSRHGVGGTKAERKPLQALRCYGWGTSSSMWPAWLDHALPLECSLLCTATTRAAILQPPLSEVVGDHT